MGRIAKLLSFTRVIKNGARISDVQVDPGGDILKTTEHFAPPGDDAFPLKTDRPFIQANGRQGGESTIGYADPISTPVALEGDKRIYGRSANGVTVNQVWLKNDGSILISNDNGSFLLQTDGSIAGTNSNGSFELESGGDFVVNGVIIDVAGNVTTTATVTASTVVAVTSLTVDGKEVLGHNHTQPNDLGGNVEQPTDAF